MMKPQQSQQSQQRPASQTRYRVVAPIKREGQEKTFWQRVGTAFENAAKNGGEPSITVKFDALPLTGEVVLFPDDGKNDD